MARRTAPVTQIGEIEVTKDTIILYKATKPLQQEAFELLSQYVKSEGEKIGVKTLLVPFTAEVEVTETAPEVTETAPKE